MDRNLSFLTEAPTHTFRVLKRKGELRYIASNQRGSLKALTCFAPPTKPLPRVYLKSLGLIDFRVPGTTHLTGVSKRFLTQVTERLEIPGGRVGIYVGEPNDRRKLVIIDTVGESKWVLKVAVGETATVAIQNELYALERIPHEGHEEHEGSDFVNFALSVRDLLCSPEVREVEPICGRKAILIERIEGRQLTPEEFEEAFWGEESGFKQQVVSFKSKGIAVGEWIERIPKPEAQGLKPHLAVCRDSGAFSLRSPLGLVHGDFAPWNTIRTSESSVKQVADLEPNHVKPKTVDGNSRRLFAVDWEFSRAETPLIFDYAYAAWCYSELLGRRISGIDDLLWNQLVALGALWKEVREIDLGY